MWGLSGLIFAAVEDGEGVIVTSDNLVGDMPEVERHSMPEDVNHSRQIKLLFWIDLCKKLCFPTDLGDAGGDWLCWGLSYSFCIPLFSSLMENWPFGMWHPSKCMVKVLCLWSWTVLNSETFGYFISSQKQTTFTSFLDHHCWFYLAPSQLLAAGSIKKKYNTLSLLDHTQDEGGQITLTTVGCRYINFIQCYLHFFPFPLHYVIWKLACFGITMMILSFSFFSHIVLAAYDEFRNNLVK